MLCPVGQPLLLIERLFIRQDGKRIGYSQQYSLSEFGQLQGTSGNHI